ncbi:hypothetical protein EJ06DRAFT_406518 [Trichodelitschia bisporula]|uniref:Autophagy-related protein 3 n=1 Tax=Trichodelitschia bisporula TaxID=703511 RepID=A0A6G1HY72_9PEZI|nr:hypothetical protein EJ06DRAFT_406518 [Trichodelitschia bisporula]
MNYLYSTVNSIRDRYTPVRHTSTFRSTGQITPEEFLLAGDFLVYKFPSWSWSDASHPSRRVAYLPEGKQFLVTRGVPCPRRLNNDFAGDAGTDETIVRDGLDVPGGDDEGWLRTGGMAASQEARVKDVRTVDESGRLGELGDEEEDIPDMEDEEDDEEAIIRDGGEGDDGPSRTYNLYIMYSPYYRTPRLYLSGYNSRSEPLSPPSMMEDIVGDYKEKTVTLEDFPFFESALKMASVHPCKHAAVMKALLDRADAALKLRMQRLRSGQEGTATGRPITGLEGLVDNMKSMQLSGVLESNKPKDGDEWEVLQEPGKGEEEEEVAIRVDQYLVVFLKFMASVTPGIEYDFTMGV